MFLLPDDTVVYSASDLANAAGCEFAVLRTLDAKLGRIPPIELTADAMLERAARLGDEHEQRWLARYRERYGQWDRASGTGVVEIDRPARGLHSDRATLQAKHAETIEALRTGADVVFQAGFFDGRFGGWADFIVRQRPDGAAGPVYAVHDTKLARRAKVTALLQLAAYADQLMAAGIATAPEVHLILGDDTTTTHSLVDLLPVYRERRDRLQTILDERVAAGTALEWGTPGYTACLRCEICAPEIAARRDVLLVAGLRATQRARLDAVGVHTVEELAAGTGDVPGIAGPVLARLRAQARLQVAQGIADAAMPADPAPRAQVPVFDLFAPEVIGHLPAPDAGDIFFDFEGDPLWTGPDGDGDGDAPDWGLEYLFGVIEAPVASGAEPAFRPFWAHDRPEEKRALLDFLGYVEARRARFPGMHVYHYAAYEKTALLRLAGRYGVGEESVDQLLREGVLVDLYATVRASLRTGQSSYSLKSVEKLYMDAARAGDVITAGDSIVEYAEACAVRASDPAEWERRLQQIAQYNAYDCLSTLGLRDWLVARAAELGVRPGTAAPAPDDGSPGVLPGSEPPADGPDGPAAAAPQHDALAAELLAFADAAE
ncbi:TM0106 family RecB-like putative nuclease [Cellulomonas sp. KRMCY2]|uniref:TM0106 family RecB-like putative nuclease n=1 Tax=Cellulomonas sp. KRMCY2 TaxID=1304865 RepID=UPI0004B0DBBD|nr:TM0106 family RecB-like putative nuclease [Cellulomonas sp. KRMCY2]